MSTIPKSEYFTAPYLPTAGVLRDTDIKHLRPTVSVKGEGRAEVYWGV